MPATNSSIAQDTRDVTIVVQLYHTQRSTNTIHPTDRNITFISLMEKGALWVWRGGGQSYICASTPLNTNLLLLLPPSLLHLNCIKITSIKNDYTDTACKYMGRWVQNARLQFAGKWGCHPVTYADRHQQIQMGICTEWQVWDAEFTRFDDSRQSAKVDNSIVPRIQISDSNWRSEFICRWSPALEQFS